MKKLPYRVGIALILVCMMGSTLVDSMFKLMSVMLDGLFMLVAICVIWFMAPKEKPPEE